MSNENSKEKIPNSFKPKIADINYLFELTTKYCNLSNKSTEYIGNIINKFENELKTSRQIEQIPSDVIKLLKDSFDAVKSNIKDNKKNLDCIAADIFKFLKSMERNCLMTKVKSNPITNKEINGGVCKKQKSENKYYDKTFSNEIHYAEIKGINNSNNRKSNISPKIRYNTRSFTKNDIKNKINNKTVNIIKYCPTEHNRNISIESTKYHTKSPEIKNLRKEIESKDKEIESLKSTLKNIKKDKRIFKEKINNLQNELIKKEHTNLEINNEYNKMA